MRTRQWIATVMLALTLLLGFSAIEKVNGIPMRTEPRWDEQLVISVKTSKKFHETRVREIADTWFRDAPNNVFFFTDTEDDELNKALKGHLINSQCSTGHTRRALCCKMNAELEFFVAKDARWSCHFDDDNYVNVPILRKVLDRFDYNKDFYLGKPSTAEPIQTAVNGSLVKFWFATGGAGVCLSRSLVRRLHPYIANGGFVALGEKIKLPDDVTLGYLIVELLNVKLTVLKSFHSHLEDLAIIRDHAIREQISFSAGEIATSHGVKRRNVVMIPRALDMLKPSENMNFQAIFCFLHPNTC